MRILFINPSLKKLKITRDMAGGLGFDASAQTILPPAEFAILATILSRKHQVSLIDAGALMMTDKEIEEKIYQFSPDITFISAALPSLKDDIEFFNFLRKITDGKIWIKTSITHKPILSKILLETGSGQCIVGEVERNIIKIVDGSTQYGTAYLSKNGNVVYLPAPLIEDMDYLPYNWRDILSNNLYSYPLLGNKCTTIQTSRGCPFPCSYYCPYPLVQGKKWRAMSPERVYKEIKHIAQKNNIKKILFRDATLTLDRDRTRRICQKIINEKLNIGWWCETRVNCLDEQLLRLMKKAGCRGINIGVETGDPKVMAIQGKPGVDIDQLVSLKKAADKIGIKFHFLLIIGLPREDKHSLYQTFKLIKKLNPYSLGVTVITPYPGTKLYTEAVEKKWLEAKDWSLFSGNKSTMHTDNLKSWEIKFMQKVLQGELMLLKQGQPGRFVLEFVDIAVRLWSKS